MKYIFDVDGVLCDTGCLIDPNFKEWFINWSKDKEYYLVTGGRRESTIMQVGIEIVSGAKMAFHCMSNHIVIDNEREFHINQITLTEEETNFLLSKARNSNCIDHRGGSINFSILGLNATVEEKLKYKLWDDINHERIDIIKEFTQLFPRFEAFIGGNASIDICLAECNKSQILQFINNMHDCIFFGDKCFEYGIDNPLANLCNWVYNEVIEVNGYKETWEKLMKPMKFIAHRGLFNGPDVNLENRPEQIELAISEGFECEVDLWVVQHELFLGHDHPDYKIGIEFLDKPLWIHAKNLEALTWLSKNNKDYNYFWHENDAFTVTSKGLIWTLPGNEVSHNSVMVMPEYIDKTLSNVDNARCYGICSDYIKTIREKICG